jgi:hypothetical protein
MKIRPPALGVDEFNSGTAKITLEGFHFRQAVSEDLARQERQLAQLFHDIGMQGDDRLLVVLGGRGADVDERLIGVQMQIVGLHQFEFLAAQAGVHRRQIDHLARTCHGQKAGNLVVCKGATGTGLLAVSLHLPNAKQGIAINALMFLHPVEKRTGGCEILVECLGG